MPEQATSGRSGAEQRMSRAAENLKEIQRLIEPYVKHTVVTYPEPVREWKSDDATVTKGLPRRSSRLQIGIFRTQRR
jgi:hypothetical protein